VTAHLIGLGLDVSGVDLSARMVETHVGHGDVVRSKAYGGVPVSWTTHLWQPEQLTGLLTAADLEVVAEVRLPESPPSRPAVVLAARRPA